MASRPSDIILYLFSLLPISCLGCYNSLLTSLSASVLACVGSYINITASRILWKIKSDHVFLPSMVSCQKLSYYRFSALSVASEWDALPKSIYPYHSFPPFFKVFTQRQFNQAGLSWPTSLAIPILLILLYFFPSTETIWHGMHLLVYSFVSFSLLTCKSQESRAFILFTTEFLLTTSVLEHGGCTLVIAGWMTKWT